jgi:hypothetical protein
MTGQNANYGAKKTDAVYISDTNIAENELSSMTRQCITGRRFGTMELLQSETAAWQTYSNVRQRGVDWQFKVDDARRKLKSVYPKVIV